MGIVGDGIVEVEPSLAQYVPRMNKIHTIWSIAVDEMAGILDYWFAFFFFFKIEKIIF